MTMDKNKALLSLKQDLGVRLVDIEDLCHGYGLRNITEFTLIARDPNNDKLSVVVTSESKDGLVKATNLALGLTVEV